MVSAGLLLFNPQKGSRLNVQQARRLIHIIHHTSLLKTLPVDENLIMPSQGLLPGWTIPQWQDVDETPLPKNLPGVSPSRRAAYDGGTASTLPATLGCELTLIFHNAKNWDNCPALAQADLMMGDRLIGEAPEYTLEQWLRCDQIWSHVTDAPAFSHLQATLDALQIQPNEKIAAPRYNKFLPT